MKPSAARLALLLALPCAPLAAGCGRGAEERAGAPEGSARIDTTNQGALDGLSAEQIEASARPMTPEQAEALGIVDTTIHMESQQNPADSAIVPGGAQGRGGPPPPDTAAR